jgi:cysteinyl-tRNA synthetase
MESLSFFNSLSGEKEAFQPNGTPVKLYVCGPTVYDSAHLGHARCYITWDVLLRVLRFAGYSVTYVRNVTDIDDKILARAKENGTTREALATEQYHSFKADMLALNVLSPDREPHATHHIDDMFAGISELIKNGSAYATPDGSAYFRVSAKADYGKLKFCTENLDELKAHLEDLKVGARVEADEDKESPLDFALWKAIPDFDPDGWHVTPELAAQKVGRGRPGWHLECSAMNHAIFNGEPIDIHAGGADLIFPHHENEIAQSEAWMGKKPFAKLWMHNGFVKVDGKKMSKSLGNFSTVAMLLERYDANAIRHFLLSKGYRMPVDFTDEALQASTSWVKNCAKLLRAAQEQLNIDINAIDKQLAKSVKESSNIPALQGMFEDLSDDLNTSKALSRIYEAIGHLKTLSSEALQEQFFIALSMWNLLGFDIQSLFSAPELPIEGLQNLLDSLTGDNTASSKAIDAVLSQILVLRKQAKAEKNWAIADTIRKQLGELNLQVLDSKDGSTRLELEGSVIASLN